MRQGNTILILPSIALKDLRLDALIGKTAEIVEVVGPYNHEKGCWVRLASAYLGETEWYIPYNSVGLCN